MADPPRRRRHADDQGRMPRNRARTMILLAALAVLVVIFGYMLLVSQAG